MPEPAAAVLVTVQLVGRSCGPQTNYTSASVLRRRSAAQRVQHEFETAGSCSKCAPSDVRETLAERGVDFRRSAQPAELVPLVEKMMPVVAAGQTHLDSIQCSVTMDWVAADVRATVADQCGVSPARLRSLHVGDRAAPESATFGELGIDDGSTLWLVVGSDDEPAQKAQRIVSAQTAIRRQRVHDAKKQQIAVIKNLLRSGEKHQQLGEWRPAANCYSQAIISMHAENPELQSLLSNRGLCRYRMGEYRTAWMDHDRALDLAPSVHSRTLHYLNRGNCAVRLGMLEEAQDDFKMASLHARTHSIRSGAAKQLQRLEKPLHTAVEGHFAWLRRNYPAVAASRHCASVDAFQQFCQETRHALGRQIKTLAHRHDRCALVHKKALETICTKIDVDPGPVTVGARAEFERMLKQEARALLMSRNQQLPQTDRSCDGGSIRDSSQQAVECESSTAAESQIESDGELLADIQVETIHESEIREARENEEKRIATQETMVGNVASGFVLMRERKAVYAINHRGSQGSGLETDDATSERDAGAPSGGSEPKLQRRPATAPASSNRSSGLHADTTRQVSDVNLGRGTGAMKQRRALRHNKLSLETTFQRLLPTSVADTDSRRTREATTADDVGDDGSNDGSSRGSIYPHTRTRTGLAQKEKLKLLEQQCSIERLSHPTGSHAKPAAKILPPAQQHTPKKDMERLRRQTQLRLLRTELCPGRDTPCAGQLHDTASYRDKTKPRGGPPGNLYRGRASRVAQMALGPDVVSMESLMGDWTKAEAAAHFFKNNGGPQSDSQHQPSASNRTIAQWSAWSAWQEELSYRQCEEAKSGGTSDASGRLSKLTVKGCNAGMLSVPRFLAVP